MRLDWVKFLFEADPGAGGGDGKDTPPPAQPPAENPPEGDDVGDEDWEVDKLPAGARAYIKKMREKEADRRVKAREAEAAQAEADRVRQAEENKRLAEQQKWQELAANHEKRVQELEPIAKDAKRIREAFTASLNARLANLPEHMQDLAKMIPDPVELSNWLDANADKLTSRRAPGLDGGPKGDTGAKLTPEELEYARRMGISAEEYAKYK